jgi:hypothetical protein
VILLDYDFIALLQFLQHGGEVAGHFSLSDATSIPSIIRLLGLARACCNTLRRS